MTLFLEGNIDDIENGRVLTVELWTEIDEFRQVFL